jgi:hypothetical protein
MNTFTEGQTIKVLEDEKEIGEVTVVEVAHKKRIVVNRLLSTGEILKFSFVEENDFWFVLDFGIFGEKSINQNFPYTLSSS